MKINIDTIYKNSFYKKLFLVCGMFFILFNIQLSFNQNSIQDISFTNKCDAQWYKFGMGKKETKTKQITIDHKWSDNPMIDAIHWLLLAVLKFIGLGIVLTTSMMSFSISPEFSNALFNSDGVYAGWKIVRDFLNIFFVFFLLFSAFATVFQVQSYHIKKTWVLIIVMALLVNFSWPITRVIIDFTNVLMVTILGADGTTTTPASGLISRFSDSSQFVKSMIGEDFFKGNEVQGGEEGLLMALLLGIGVGLFILFTFFTIMLLLMARTILLVILLIFAPIGYVLLAFPSTKSYASGWWNLLFKQAFVGPIVIFLLYLSTIILGDMTTTNSDTLGKILTENGIKNAFTGLSSVMLAMGLFWTSILAAQKMSGQTANLALAGAKKARGAAIGMTKAGGKGLDNITGGHVGGTVQGVRQQFKNYGKNYQAKKDAVADRVTSDKMGYGEANNRKRENKSMLDQEKKNKESGITHDEAAKKAETEKDPGKLRAYLAHAQKGDNFGKDTAVYDKLVQSLDKLSKVERESARKKIDNAYKDKGNGDTVFDHKLDQEIDRSASTAQQNTVRQSVANDVYGNMDAKTWAKQGNTMNKIGSADFNGVQNDLDQKLDRVSFARDIQKHANTEVYGKMQGVNPNLS